MIIKFYKEFLIFKKNANYSKGFIEWLSDSNIKRNNEDQFLCYFITDYAMILFAYYYSNHYKLCDLNLFCIKKIYQIFLKSGNHPLYLNLIEKYLENLYTMINEKQYQEYSMLFTPPTQKSNRYYSRMKLKISILFFEYIFHIFHLKD